MIFFTKVFMTEILSVFNCSIHRRLLTTRKLLQVLNYRMMKGARLITLVTCCLAAAGLMVFLFVENKKLNSSSGVVDVEKREVSRDLENLKDLQEKEVKAEDKKNMTIDDWLQGRFSYRTFYPSWTTGGNYVQRNSNGSFSSVNVETEEEEIILPAEAWINTRNPFSWLLSGDGMYIAILYQATDGYAHYMRTFSIDIWNLANDTKLSVGIPAEKIQNFKWAPTGNGFAYVHGFDVYLAQSVSSTINQITSDGDEQLLFNGIADWLFSVEITDDDILMWWSPDGQYLAYATINQASVDIFEFTIYNNQQYPETVRLPYPKPSRPIPETSITIIDVATLNPTPLTPNIKTSWNDGYYLNSAVWRNNIFTPTWKNRYENEAISDNCPAPDFSCSHVSSMEQSSATGWLGHYKVSHIYPTNNDEEYLTVESSNGFPHVALHDVANNATDMRTSGEFEVTDTGYGYDSIHYYDATNDWVYYTSTENEEAPGEGLARVRHLWRVKGHGENRERECMTRGRNDGGDCGGNWVNPSFSSDGSFVSINCGGRGNEVPTSLVYKRNSGTGDYEFLRVQVDNANLNNTVNEYNFRSMEFGSLQLPDVEGDWNYMLLKPPNFDPTRKYPLLVQVYSGPGFQEVRDRFSVSWKDYIASSKDVVVMSFDGRGTGYRGDEIMHMVYQKLGQFEPLDQIEAARIVGSQNSFIDTSRTAIWGWSYGGYATSRTIGEDSDNVFRCGFAVAPVTKWELYHTIYTERYMWQPSDNPDGYEKSTTLQKFENFGKHRYTMFHGTRDENVHFQNAAQLSKYLIGHDVEFRAFFAADDDHGMSRVPNNYRTIHKMLEHQMDLCFA